MKKLTKYFLWVLIIIISVFTLVSCGNDKTPDTPDLPNTPDKPSVLRVGVATPNIGSFLPNNLTGGDNIETTKKLIFGYSLITYTKNGKYEVDKTVVKDFTIDEIVGVGTQYTVKLWDDLKWSNGETVTAKDYVGGLLLFRNALYYETTEQRASFFEENVLGTQEYYDNKTGLGELKGVKLINDYEFSYILTDEWKYTSISDISVTPYPMNVLLPGVIIEQGTEGAKFSGKTTEEVKTIIYNTVINNGKGYKYYPSVTCGPYKVESFDSEIWTFTKNEYYKGNYEGQIPKIDKITFEYIVDDLTALKKGKIDLSLDLGIDVGKLTEEDSNIINYTNFEILNVKLGFHADKGVTRFKEIRQAVAYLTDNKTIYGDYSLDQWMTKESLDENSNVLGINEEGEKVPLNKYEFNIDKATQLIEQAGYIYGDEQASKLYTSGDNLRYRKNDDGTIEALTLDVFTTETLKYVFDNLVEETKKIGFKINLNVSDHRYINNYYYAFLGDGYENIPEDATYEEILASYNKEKDNRIGNAYLWPSNYGINLIDASFYTSLENWGNEGNIYFLYDESLDDAAKDLDSAKTMEEYLEAWQIYQYHFNENLPFVSLCHNEGNIVFSNKLLGLKDNITYYWDWTQQILYCEMA